MSSWSRTNLGIFSVGVSLAMSACGGSPPLRVVRNGEAVNVDLRTLGEYQSSVSRVILREGDADIIWEVDAVDPWQQPDGFELRRGANSALLRDTQGRRFKVVAPAIGNSFVLDEGRSYHLEVCSGDEATRCSTATIRF